MLRRLAASLQCPAAEACREPFHRCPAAEVCREPFRRCLAVTACQGASLRRPAACQEHRAAARPELATAAGRNCRNLGMLHCMARLPVEVQARHHPCSAWVPAFPCSSENHQPAARHPCSALERLEVVRLLPCSKTYRPDQAAALLDGNWHRRRHHRHHHCQQRRSSDQAEVRSAANCCRW